MLKYFFILSLTIPFSLKSQHFIKTLSEGRFDYIKGLSVTSDQNNYYIQSNIIKNNVNEQNIQGTQVLKCDNITNDCIEYLHYDTIYSAYNTLSHDMVSIQNKIIFSRHILDGSAKVKLFILDKDSLDLDTIISAPKSATYFNLEKDDKNNVLFCGDQFYPTPVVHFLWVDPIIGIIDSLNLPKYQITADVDFLDGKLYALVTVLCPNNNTVYTILEIDENKTITHTSNLSTCDTSTLYLTELEVHDDSYYVLMSKLKNIQFGDYWKIYLRKYDKGGSLIWERLVGPDGYNHSNYIYNMTNSTDNSGIITGGHANNKDVSNENDLGDDYFYMHIAKHSYDGDLLWEKRLQYYDPTLSEYQSSTYSISNMHQAGSGDLFLTGSVSTFDTVLNLAHHNHILVRTDKDGCITDECKKLVNTSDIEHDPFIIVYPNPTADLLYFEGTNDIQVVNLYNETGQLFQITRVHNNSINIIDMHSMKPGVYYLDFLYTNGEKQVRKVVKI